MGVLLTAAPLKNEVYVSMLHDYDDSPATHLPSNRQRQELMNLVIQLLKRKPCLQIQLS